MKAEFRCECPITSALDVVGDKWLLVIIKQMLVEGKQTFKDFTQSDEAIATNILTAKLKFLEENGLIEKKNHPTNKKTKLYHLTELGISLTPVIVELAFWSDVHIRAFHPEMQAGEAIDFLRNDKVAFANELEKKYREKLAVMLHGENL